MLSVSLLVYGRLLAVKFLVGQKLSLDFWLGRGSALLAPVLFRGQLYFTFNGQILSWICSGRKLQFWHGGFFRILSWSFSSKGWVICFFIVREAIVSSEHILSCQNNRCGARLSLFFSPCSRNDSGFAHTHPNPWFQRTLLLSFLLTFTLSSLHFKLVFF